MGFEPTTFCMAIREDAGELRLSIKPIRRAFAIDEAAHIQRDYA